MNVRALALGLTAALTACSSGGDSTPPPGSQLQISFRDPAPGATSVPIGTSVTVGFNLPLAGATVDATSFTVLDDVASPVAGTVSSLGNNATFVPSAPLRPLTTYQVRVSTAVASSDGLHLAAADVWSFTTTSVATPAAPGGVTATAGDAQVTISWSPAATATSYNAYWSTDAGVSPATGTAVTGVSSPWVHTGRTNGVHYYYVVTAVNGAGEGPASATVGATPLPPPPAAPTGATATAADGQVSVAWGTVTGATSYNLYWSTTAGVSPQNGAAVLGVTSPYLHSSLSNGTTYYYVVTAVGPGGEGQPSSQVSAMPVPPAPAAPVLSAAPADGKVTLTWTPAAGASSYDLYVSSVPDALANGVRTADVTSPYDVAGVNGQTYYYVVVARNLGGETASNELSSIPTAGPPAAPGSLAAAGFDGRVVLNWPASATATSYDLYWSAAAGVTPATGTRVAGVVSPYSFSGTNGTPYHFVVVATNLAGDSAPSPEASATPHRPVPSAPAGLVATAGDATITVAWPAAVGATSYDLYWSNAAGVTPATGARVQGVTSPLAFAATNGATYHFVVTAVSADGASGPSPEASATPVHPAPRPPTGVTAVAGDAAATVSWSAVAGATSYDVYWSTSANVTPATGMRVASATSPQLVVGLANGTTHYFVVTATDSGGESAPSLSASALPLPPPPAAPATVTAVAGDASATVTWSASVGAVSYDLYWTTADVATRSNCFKVANATSPFTHTGLDNGTTYRYLVVANGALVSSADSMVASATPIEQTPPTVAPVAPEPDATWVSPYAQVSASFSEPVIAADVEAAFTLSDGGLPVAGSWSYSSTHATFTPTAALAGGTTYTATIAAGVRDLAGNPLAAPLSWSFTVAPAGPTGLAAVVGNGDLTLTWDVLPGAVRYQVYRSDPGAPGIALVGTTETTIFTDRGIANGVPYTYYVSAFTTGETVLSAPLTTSPSAAAPATPTTVYAVASDAQVTLTWTGSSGAYQVLASDSEAGPFVVVATGVPGTSFTENGLTNGVARYYVVQGLAVTTAGAWSEMAVATPTASALVAPAGLSASPGNTWARLAWSPVAGATGYQLLRSPYAEGPFARVADTAATSFDDTGLSNGVTYYWTVVATAAGGTVGPRAAPVAAMPSASGAPQAPVLVGSALNLGARLVPTACAGASGYEVYYSTVSGGGYVLASATGSPVSPVDVTGLGANVTYYFVARALNGAVAGGWSNEVAVTTLASPVQTPTNLRMLAGSGYVTARVDPVAGAISYYWTVKYTDGTSFTASYSALPNFTFAAVNGTAYDVTLHAYGPSSAVSPETAAVRVTPGATGLGRPSMNATAGNANVLLEWGAVSGATDYVIYRWSDGPDWQPIATLAAGTTRYRDLAVQNGTQYRYTMAARSGATEGPWSSESWYVTPAASYPSTPADLLAQPGNGAVTIRWSPVPGAVSYLASVFQADGTHLSNFWTELPHYTFTGLANGQAYLFAVRADDGSRSSSVSDRVTATPSAIGLAKPYLTPTAGNGEVLLTWQPVSGATGYAIYRWSGGPDWQPLTTLAAGTTRYRDTSVLNDRRYRYVVAAKNGATEGPWSEVSYNDPRADLPVVATNLRTQAGDGAVTVRWNPVPGANAYLVRVFLADGTSVAGSNWIYRPEWTFPDYYSPPVNNGQTYLFEVLTGDGVGSSPPSERVAATPIAGALGRSEYLNTRGGRGEIELKWGPVAGATQYALYRWTSGPDWELYKTLAAGATSYRDAGLVDGAAYGYAIAAMNGATEGPWREYSATADFNYPAAPSNVRAQVGSRAVTLRWDLVPGAVSYHITTHYPVGLTGGARVSLPEWTVQNAYGEPPVNDGETFTFEVRAEDGARSSLPVVIAGTPTAGALPQSTSLSLSNGNGEILAQWAPVTGATQYVLYRWSSGPDWQVYRVMDAQQTRFHDFNVVNGTFYRYAIAALSGATEGPWREASTTADFNYPATPTNVRMQVGSQAVTLRWDPVPGAVSYHITTHYPVGLTGGARVSLPEWTVQNAYGEPPVNDGETFTFEVRAEDGARSSLPVVIAGTPTAGALPQSTSLSLSNGNGEILAQWAPVTGATQYVLYRWSSGPDWQLHATIVGGATRYRDQSVVNGTTYRYAVAAVNGAVEGPWREGSTTADFSYPATPSNIAIIPGSGAVTLAWDPVPGASDYRVEVFQEDGSGVGSCGWTTMPACTFSLTNGQPYLFELRSGDGAGKVSPLGDRVAATPDGTRPAATTASVAAGTATLTVSWSAVTDAVAYRVYRLGATSWELIGETPDASFVDSSVTTGASASYAVSAVNGAGEGAWSNVVTGTAL